MNISQAQHIAIQTLKQLIRIPSVSGKEKAAAACIQNVLEGKGFPVLRKNNNVWSVLKKSGKLPTLLLNSHIDTVPPGEGWTTDPYDPVDDGEKITGLGSNDAGASLVSLMVVFMMLSRESDLPFNIIYAASAEEEISGKNGIVSILDEIGPVDLGIVGEPTGMAMAISEKGLLVLDCMAHGVTGHAARNKGENAIYLAMHDIDWIKNYRFIKKSKMTGEVTMQVTQINGGIKHNVIPGQCSFVVDVRTNDQYTNEQVLNVIRQKLTSTVMARSTRLNASAIDPGHPMVEAACQLKIDCTGSDTLSDQALMTFPTVKIGPGSSERSHTADEYIEKQEIFNGIETYLKLLKKYTALIIHKGIYEDMG
jgi:acetylornithine deacetylase